VIGGLLLALVSAALINLGFLLQHRALRHCSAAGGMVVRLRRSLKDPMWLAGQGLGWLGFGLQVVAVAIAPLALVQAFAAGGLALSLPLAAGLFRQRVTRRQALAVLLMAAGLAVLPIGFSSAADRLQPGRLIAIVAVGSVAGAAVAWARAPAARAAAAGIFYGLADAAIKAISLDWHHQGLAGLAGLAGGWPLVAGLGTFAGFLCFQSALEAGDAVPGISLMTAATALVALACGLVAFGESLGAGAAASVLHGLAIAGVLAVVPALAAAHTAIVKPTDPRDERPAPRPRPRPLPAIERPR
jgi:drug/metabolite transporter (DMT)-like permease